MSFETLHQSRNELSQLKPYLFRSATLSVFGHIVVNSMTYIQRNTLVHPFLHVVTGSPGMGKSTSRYPFITLLMSFGVKDLKTMRHCESALGFRRTNKTKASSAIVTIKDSDGHDITVEVPTYLYHYDVRIYHQKYGSIQMSHSSAEAIYYPTELDDKSSVYLGQLVVPSVEYFPRFLRLMIGKTEHVYKQLTKTEHDITITAPSYLKKGTVIAQSSVLIVRGKKPVEYTQPTTEIHIDLTIEAVLIRPSYMDTLFTTNSKTLDGMSSMVSQSQKNHPSQTTTMCPQYDCHNWVVQFATDQAQQFVLNMFDLPRSRDYHTFLTSMAKHPESNPINGVVFRNFVLDAIAGGLTIISPSRLTSSEPLDCGRLALPKVVGESTINLRSSSNIRRVCLPDISRIDHSQLLPFEQNYNILYENPILPCSMEFTDPTGKDNLQLSIQGTPDFKCFTYSLNPQGGNHAGLHSIVLFFKLHVEEQKLVIDALSVLFIHSTLDIYRTISSSEANMMFLWLALFSNVYNLNPSAVFPFLFFVKSPFVDTLVLYGENTTKFFMDERNIWVMNGHTRNVNSVNVEYNERPLLDPVVPLVPNTNPDHFRCCFCKQILKQDFANHCCPCLRTTASVSSSEQLITTPWAAYSSGMGKVGIYDRHNPQVNSERKSGFRSITDVVLTLTREGEPDDSLGRSSTIRCGEREIHLNYINKERSLNTRDPHNKTDTIDILLIAPTERRDDVLPLMDVSSELEPSSDSFRVKYDGPILDLFTYSTRRPVAAETFLYNPTNLPIEDYVLQMCRDNEAFTVEAHDPHSHLHESINLIRLWGKKKAIGFTKTEEMSRACEVGILQTQFCDVDELCQNESIPLPQLFVPMDCLSRLPVSLYGTPTLLPFEIKCILNGACSSDRLMLGHFYSKDHLRHGQPMALDHLKKIVGDDDVKTPLLTKWMTPLRSHRESFKEISMSDFQLLSSYVSGSPLIIADILELCMKYLIHIDQLTLRELNFLIDYVKDPATRKRQIQDDLKSKNEETKSATQNELNNLRFRVSQSRRLLNVDSSSFIGSLDGEPTLCWPTLDELAHLSRNMTSKDRGTFNAYSLREKLTKMTTQMAINLDFMELLLKQGLTVLKEQLQLLVEQVIEGKHLADFTDEDRIVVLDRFRTNPLLYPWHRLKLIPFLTDVSHIQEQKRFMIDRLSEDSPLQQREIELLCSFLTIQAPLKVEETQHLISLVEGSGMDAQAMGMLIDLIRGKLKSGQRTYHRLSNIKIKDYYNKWYAAMHHLGLNQLQESDRAFLRECLEKQTPLDNSQQIDLSSLVDHTTISTNDKNTLLSMITGKPFFSPFHREAIVSSYLDLQEYFNDESGLLFRIQDSKLNESDKIRKINQVMTELTLSDREIAVKCVFHPIHSAEQDISLLFKILKGEEHVDEQRRQELIRTMHDVRADIIQTMRDLFDRLSKGRRLSWTDLAALLCSPNGSLTTNLIAIRALGDDPQMKTKGLKDETICSISDRDWQLDNSSVPPSPFSSPFISLTDLEDPSSPLPFRHRPIVKTRKIKDKRSGAIDRKRG
ncbi:hypothetical protein BLNAU_18812 [Blattamonas nauphoetae]|uniref:Uncharacterized protein n=1 Tax=Blattamonas nauphoetae TaxID=2049346 RepID=A0ABQ9X3F5_9EUKA|nr:hypothetical protein BLNAU_18812 [Blattamonas nauphoetae]